MRIPIRTSRLAIWSRRLGSFALPLVLVPILLHRERAIATEPFHVTELVAGAAALLAVGLGAAALVRLWFTGDRGWARALGGIALGLVSLLPAAWLGWNAWRYPPAQEVSTDYGRPLALSMEQARRTDDPALRNAVAIAFPSAISRTYPVTVTDLFAIAERLVSDQGWELRLRRVPSGPGGEGQLNAVVMTLFGWREEVAIRVTDLGESARIDMRSASQPELPIDFGSNGRRIETFLAGLDAALRQVGGAPIEAAAPEEPAEDEGEQTPLPRERPTPLPPPVANDNEPVEG